MMKKRQINKLVKDIQDKVNKLHNESINNPEIKDIFDQNGLLNGREIIEEFLKHNELRVALDHLLYMISETQILLNNEEVQIIKFLCNSLDINISNFDLNIPIQ